MVSKVMEKRNGGGSSAFSLLFEVSVPHVVCRIFLDGDLDAADVANCRSVCKAWKAFIDAHILGRERDEMHETSASSLYTAYIPRIGSFKAALCIQKKILPFSK